MMLARVLGAILATVVGGVLASPAFADIYTWVDKSGTTNVSNLPPPEDARVTKVQHDLPPEIVAREDAARDAAKKAETDALVQRVNQLESQVAAAQGPPPDYRPPLPPPIIQYIVEPQPAPMQLTVETGSPAYGGYDYGCNPSWAGCALWWPGFYPGVIVVSNPARPTHPIHHGKAIPNPMPFGPKLTNVVAPVTSFAPALTNAASPVTGFSPVLTSVVPPIPQSFAVQRNVNPSLGLRRG